MCGRARCYPHFLVYISNLPSNPRSQHYRVGRRRKPQQSNPKLCSQPSAKPRGCLKFGALPLTATDVSAGFLAGHANAFAIKGVVNLARVGRHKVLRLWQDSNLPFFRHHQLARKMFLVLNLIHWSLSSTSIDIFLTACGTFIRAFLEYEANSCALASLEIPKH